MSSKLMQAAQQWDTAVPYMDPAVLAAYKIQTQDKQQRLIDYAALHHKMLGTDWVLAQYMVLIY